MVVAATVEIDLKKRSTTMLLLLLLSCVAEADLQVVVIEGLGGEARFTEQFAEQVSAVSAAADAMTTAKRVETFRNGEYSRESIIEFFAELNNRMTAADSLVVYLIGHGSYDDYYYKFNISGPDLSGDDLKTLLDANLAGVQLIVNTGSSSGAMRELLEREGRTLILATRSGAERHATRFGNFFAAGLTAASADIDKNNIVTAGEAYAYAERQVADYYERNGQLATEHPRIEGGNGNRIGLARLGTRSGARTVVRDDSELRRLLSERDRLNNSIDALRMRRDDMAPERYQNELLQNMLELATLEESIEEREAELPQ